MARISVVVNTWNEEKNIKRCLESVKWADEVVVVDMHSADKTAEIAKKLGAKVFYHKYTTYVEPARNFALRQAQGDWVLILDADEKITPILAKQLRELTKEPKGISFFRLPRKNIIFGKWVKYSRWWPDYNLRFFKKGAVTWSEKIHSIPLTHGEGQDLEVKEANAIVHYHYNSVGQYFERLNRYTGVQADELIESGYSFFWQDLLRRPVGEFLSRFFAGEGYKDGIHGLVLALLQAFAELVKYLKVWEKQGFQEMTILPSEWATESKKLRKEFTYWRLTALIEEAKNPLRKIRLRINRKLSK